MDSISNNIPDVVLDLIFIRLNQEHVHETLGVSKSWLWASVRRIRKVKITKWRNPLKSMADFYNKQRSRVDEELDWRDFFQHLVLHELIVDKDEETINYLFVNGCNTVKLTIHSTWKGKGPASFESLKKINRLQFFKFHLYGSSIRSKDPFLAECLQGFNSKEKNEHGFTRNRIRMIELSSDEWNIGSPVLQLITILSVEYATIEFLRELVTFYPNLEEVQCHDGIITLEWRHIYPENVKRIKLHGLNIEDDVDEMVEVCKDMGRPLLSYLCQNPEVVKKFKLTDVRVFLDECLWISTLTLNSLKTMAFGKLAKKQKVYENVIDLTLEYCDDEPLEKIFQVFPCLEKFIQVFSAPYEVPEWLAQKLGTNGKEYGFVFMNRCDQVWYMHYDDLESTLTETQILLEDNFVCKFYLKGFKQSLRFHTQEVHYIG